MNVQYINIAKGRIRVLICNINVSEAKFVISMDKLCAFCYIFHKIELDFFLCSATKIVNMASSRISHVSEKCNL